MRSLRTLLVRGPVLGFGLVLALLVALGAIWLRRMAWQEAEARVEASLDHVSRQLDFRLAEMERLAEAIGGAWETGQVDPADPARCWAWLGAWVRPHPHLTGVNLVRADGRGFGLGRSGELWGGRAVFPHEGGWRFSAAFGEITRADENLRQPGLPGFDFRERPWYRLGQEATGTRWTGVFRFAGRRAGKPGIFLVRAVRDPQGRLLGVLSLDLLLESLVQVVQNVRPSPGAWLLVLDGEGRVVVPPAGAEPAEDLLLQPVGPDRFPLAHDLFQRARGGERSGQASRDRFHGRIRPLERLQGPAWNLVLALPEADIDADPRRRILGAAVLGAALLAGFALLAHHFTRRANRPLTQLARSAEALAAGQPPELPSSRIREIQQLSDALAAAHRGLVERESLQERLRQSQRMEVIGTLAGGIAHDLNNQLAVILAHMELGLDKLPPDHPASANLRTAWDATRRCTETTRAILSFSRPSRPAMRPVDLNELVERTLGMLSGLVGPRIHLERDLQADPSVVLADPTQLEQLLVNLVVNARDALPAGGTIQVWTSRAGELVRLQVRDNGTGMTPDVLARIFEPFYTTKEPGKGTGLGLATALGVARAHGGELTAESLWGQGSCFTLQLPLARAEAVRRDSGELRPFTRLPGVAVLVVDDEEALREGMAEVFTSSGAEVRTAADGEEAWQFWQARAADLVVTDQLMPRCSGTDLLGRLRAAGSQVPVLILSGRGLEGLEAELAQDPRVAHLPKPFTLARLLAAAALLLQDDRN